MLKVVCNYLAYLNLTHWFSFKKKQYVLKIKMIMVRFKNEQ